MTTFVSFNSELNINNAPVGKLGDQAVLFNNDSYAPHRGYQIFTWTQIFVAGQLIEGWKTVDGHYNAYTTPFKTLLEAGLVYKRNGEKKWSFEDCKFI